MQIKVHSGRVVSLGIWDTAGAERFESLSRMYYNGAKAAILCFDPCDRKSFEKLKFWVRAMGPLQPSQTRFASWRFRLSHRDNERSVTRAVVI